MAEDAGYAMVSGDPGLGKPVTLRLLEEALAAIPDVLVGVLTRPQCSTFDFYREIGSLLGLAISPSNRFTGAKILRQRAGWSTSSAGTARGAGRR